MYLVAIDDQLRPPELKLLQDVLSGVCDKGGIPKTCADADAIWVILVRQFQKGRRDRESLISIADNLLRYR